MKQQEAKILIIREWDRWVQTQPIDLAIDLRGPTGRELNCTIRSLPF
jgi:hypothetical protein